MLAIVARSGQFLPQCLIFGPCNGPEDFAFATDRVYAPGRDRKQRFCKQWHLYADDITVRTGRVLDGVIYTDEEFSKRLEVAQESFSDVRMRKSFQDLSDTFLALGFDPTGLSAEGKIVKVKQSKAGSSPAKVRGQTEGEKAVAGLIPEGTGDRSPYAHVPVEDSACCHCCHVCCCISVQVCCSLSEETQFKSWVTLIDPSSLLESRSLGAMTAGVDNVASEWFWPPDPDGPYVRASHHAYAGEFAAMDACLLYTSDAADE